MAGDFLAEELACPGIPDPQESTKTPRNQEPTVGTERHTARDPLVPGEAKEFLAAGRVRNDDAALFMVFALPSRGQAPAVGAERHAIGRAGDNPRMPGEAERLSALRQVPDLDGFVRACGGEVLTAGVECHAKNIAFVTE